MSLADRYYMHDAYHAPRMTTRLIIVLLVAFVIQSALLFYSNIHLEETLALSAGGLLHGKVWQLITFQFLHACPMPWHVLFNCLGLYFFGRPVEEVLGSKRFLQLYLLAGVAGGLLQTALPLALPQHYDIPVVGASAGVCGMIAIFCSQNPMQELTAWLYFFPINIRARYLLIFLGLLSLYGTLVPFDSVAHGAHLGGIIVGIVYVYWGDKIKERLLHWRRQMPWTHPRPTPKAGVLRGRPWREAESTPSSRAFISQQVDPILDKISAHGIHSLTERERKLLEAARKQMGQK